MHGRNDRRDDLPSISKRAAAKGKLHQWQFRRILDGLPVYRCVVCDYYDCGTKFPRTPEPHEPYCPAPRSKFEVKQSDLSKSR